MPNGTRSSPAEGETSMNATPVVSTVLLRNVPLFSMLPEGQLQLLTQVLSRKPYPKNSTVIAAGDPTDAMYIVVSGRVARLLLEMAETIDGQKVVTKKLTERDIAKMIGASREMVSRVMKELQTSGRIEVRAREILLRDSLVLTR